MVYRIWTVADRFPGTLNDAVIATRHSFGLNIIPIGRSAIRAITETLQSNGVVVLLSDLEQGPGVSVRFFRRRATVPCGPVALAIKSGATLLPFCQYSDGGGYHVHLDPSIS